MLLHMGGSTRGWGESVCESSRCHLKNTGTSNDSIYPQGGRDCPCLPSKQPQQGFVPGPGQLSLGRSRRQWTTRGRKYSQKQLAKALAQHTPCLYLLRGLDLVQILEKKNRKCFTCYLIWSSCGAGQVPPGRLTRGVWGQAKHISSSPGISHSMTSPFSTIFPFLLFHLSLVTHRAGR